MASLLAEGAGGVRASPHVLFVAVALSVIAEKLADIRFCKSSGPVAGIE